MSLRMRSQIAVASVAAAGGSGASAASALASERLVRSIAERPLAASLAAAKEHRLVGLLRPHHRLDARLGAGVRAVAERLHLAHAACAPGIAVGREQLDLVGPLLRDQRLFARLCSHLGFSA